MPSNLLKVKISSPKEILFSGDALSVSSKNSAGNFDILPLHANFISLIEKEPIIIQKPNKETVKFVFEFAIIYQLNNQVNIYTDLKIYLR